MTKTECLKIVRQAYGPKTNLGETRGALGEAGKNLIREEIKPKRERIKVVIEEIAAMFPKTQMGHTSTLLLKDLLKAAEFVCDVDGDNPSIPELKENVAKVARFFTLVEERHDLEAEIKRMDSGLFSHRCWAYKDGMFRTILASGDTWDEVAARVEKDRTDKMLRPAI